MAEEHKNLQTYINKILEIQEKQQNKSLNEDELKQIAANIGLSEGDWEAVQSTFDNHSKRAFGYLEHQNWEDAIEEFKQALTLKPADVKSLFGIASAYQKKWLQTKQKDAKEQAEYYAKQCLQADAGHSEALKLISDLKINRTVLSPKAATQFKPVYLIAGGIAFLLFIGFFYFQQSSPNKNNLTTIPEVKTQPETETAINTQEANNGVPVKWVADENSKNINLRVEISALNVYEDSYSYTLNADLIPKGIEIEKLKLKIELIDSKGAVFATDYKEAVQDYEPTVRSGDIQPMDFLLYKGNSKAPDLKEVRLSIQLIDKQNAATTYDVSPKVPIEWSSSKPPNYEIELRERRSVYSQNSFDKGKVRHELVLEFWNKGKSNISRLQIETQWFDAQGKVLASISNYVAISSRPKLKTGESRVQYVLGQIPAGSKDLIKSYKISVTDIE